MMAHNTVALRWLRPLARIAGPSLILDCESKEVSDKLLAVAEHRHETLSATSSHTAPLPACNCSPLATNRTALTRVELLRHLQSRPL